MYKICHIRCNKNYWVNKTPHNYYVSRQSIQSNFIFSDIISFWDETLKIPYFTFRKQIRDLVIEHIHNISFFDYVFESTEDFDCFVNKNKIENYILYQQDDDDILVQIPFFQYGINVYNYSFIDVLKFRRQSKHDICVRNIFENNKQQYNIQSNHTLSFFKKCKPLSDFIHLEHTHYDKLIKNHPVSYHNEIIGLQVYHLFSQSLWFSYCKNPNNIVTKQLFYSKAVEFVDKFLLINNTLKIPLLYNFKQLYSKLI